MEPGERKESVESKPLGCARAWEAGTSTAAKTSAAGGMYRSSRHRDLRNKPHHRGHGAPFDAAGTETQLPACSFASRNWWVFLGVSSHYNELGFESGPVSLTVLVINCSSIVESGLSSFSRCTGRMHRKVRANDAQRANGCGFDTVPLSKSVRWKARSENRPHRPSSRCSSQGITALLSARRVLATSGILHSLFYGKNLRMEA